RQRAGVRSRKELGPRGGGRWSAGRIRERIGAGTSDKRGGSVWKRFYRSFYRWLCAPEQCRSRRKVRLHLRSALDRCRKQLKALGPGQVRRPADPGIGSYRDENRRAQRSVFRLLRCLLWLVSELGDVWDSQV